MPQVRTNFGQAILIVMSVTLLGTGVTGASEAIGKAEKIENKVMGAIDGKSHPLAVPDDVHRDELIRTEAKSQARLRFKDETDLRLGPRAAIKLDAFVYSGDRNAAMELVSGSMRFASGNGPKGSYLIRTPVATIGLRGTVVEVTIRNGRTYVSLHEGQAQVCTRSGRCMDLNDACTYLSVDRRGVTTPQPLSNRVPTFSGQCSGEFCVVDRCTPQLSSAPHATPPAAQPRKATPPRTTPPRTRPPRTTPRKLTRPRARLRERVIEEDIILDEPEYVRPRRRIHVPEFPVEPEYVRPRRPRGAGGYRPPKGDYSPPRGEGGPGFRPHRGIGIEGGFRSRGPRPQGGMRQGAPRIQGDAPRSRGGFGGGSPFGKRGSGMILESQ